jgi:AcrR family transcriptional regulator
VLRAAVELADAEGLEATSMRRLAEALGVTPMALYKHIANREELIDGMVDTIILQIPRSPDSAGHWRDLLRHRILDARRTLVGRPWATEAIETRRESTPTVLAYMDGLIGVMLAGGLSIDLVHHAMHALSSRMWGLTRDVFPTPPIPDDPADRSAALDAAAVDYPHIAEMAKSVASTGQGCDADVEFEFALDVMLDGFERLHLSGWTPAAP